VYQGRTEGGRLTLATFIVNLPCNCLISEVVKNYKNCHGHQVHHNKVTNLIFSWFAVSKTSLG
jgi:hypothetical protein